MVAVVRILVFSFLLGACVDGMFSPVQIEYIEDGFGKKKDEMVSFAR